MNLEASQQSSTGALTVPRTPWASEAGAVISGVGSDAVDGLSTAEVERRRSQFGSNEIDAAAPVPGWKRMLAQFRDPLVLLLLFAIVVSLLAWWFDGAEGTPIDAVVIAAIVVLNAALGFWQESKALDAVEALRTMTTAHAAVLRDGRPISVANTELVAGDIVLLAEGDAVGADSRLIEAANLAVSERSNKPTSAWRWGSTAPRCRKTPQT